MSVAMTQLKSYYGLERLKVDGEGAAQGAQGAQASPSSSNGGGAFKPSLRNEGIVETIMKKQEESLQNREEQHMMNGVIEKTAVEKKREEEAAEEDQNGREIREGDGEDKNGEEECKESFIH